MKKYIIALLVTFPLVVFSQQREIKEADNQFQQQKYFEAIKIYSKIVKGGNETPEVLEKLAEANYFNANYAQANIWYSKLVSQNKKLKSENLYRYAQTLKSVGKTDEANVQLELFKKLNANEQRAKLLNSKTNTDSRFVFSNTKSISINSSFSDYGPALNGEIIIFSSARNAFLNNTTSERTNQSYTSLFQSSKDENGNYNKPTLFSKGSFSIFNEATPVFSNDGKTMYYTQNQFVKKSNTKLENGGYKLYKSVLIKNKWKNKGAVTLGQTNTIRIAHPALSPDGKVLYFASDYGTKNGDSDLFKVSIHEDGTYGEIENLGSHINTEGRDTFPFITEDNTLIFATDGRPGMGGLDLFSIDLTDSKAKVISLGETINSPFDDFGMVISKDMTHGYYTSNKPGGKGDDDIYSFDLTLKKIVLIEIKGTIVDQETQEVQPNAAINLFDNDKNLIASINSDSTGNFVFKDLKPNTTYSIAVSKLNYQENSVSLTINTDNVEKKIEIKKIEPPYKIGDNLIEILALNNIYFDLGKYTLRPKSIIELDQVVAFLNKYNSVKIEVGSHTDSRQSDNFNIKLSKNRAIATSNYIVSKGIDKSRLILKGYGESKLVNPCSDAVKCSEEEHQKNRRSTFTIVE